MTGRPSLSPAAIFLAVALPAGLLLVVLTPPFQVPDESAHLFRAFQMAEGTFRAGSDGAVPGAELPVSLVRAADAFPPHLPAMTRGDLLARVKRGLAEPLAPRERRFFPLVSTIYSPVPYLPAAAVIAAGKAASWSPLGLLYAGRLATLLAATILHALALRVAPVFRWPLALLALTPMISFQRSGVTADSVTNALAFLFFALVLRLAAADTAPPPRPLAVLVLATTAALALCKGYAVLLPLLLVVPARPRAGRRLAWTALLLGAVLAAGWSLARRGVPVPPRLDVPVDSGGQLRTLLHEPGRFLAAAATEVATHGARNVREFLGQLGWLDVRIPAALLLVPAAALLLLVLADASAPLRLARWWRIGLLAVLGAGALSIALAMYVLHTPAGARGIEGIQGRYFIPLAPPALFLLVSRRPRLALSGRTAARIAVLAALAGLAGAAWALEERFVRPAGAPVPAAARLLQSGGCLPSLPSPNSSTSS
jgi:hypothetical protein